MIRDLVLVGAGHAHLATLHSLRRFVDAGIRVRVVDRQRQLWYSGMVPAVVAGRVAREAAAIPIAAIALRSGAEWVDGEVVAVDRAARTAALSDGREFSWDVISIASGSDVVGGDDQIDASRLVTVKPMSGLISWSDTLSSPQSGASGIKVVIAGSGPSAVEVAAAVAERIERERVRELVRGEAESRASGAIGGGGARGEQGRVVVCSAQPRLLPGLPHRAGEIAHRALVRLGVEVLPGARVVGWKGGQVALADGRLLDADTLLLATGLQPSLRPGAFAVDAALSSDDGRLFAGGDCATVADFALERVGVHAVRQGPSLLHNLLVACGVTAGPLQAYSPPARYLQLLALGGGRALAIRGDRVSAGPLWYTLKERIDWSFVKSEGRSIWPSLSPPPRPGPR